jgi:hypothetical protein
MKHRRNAVITAVMACLLSAPLAFGPYAARADEATDLRANPEVAKRLDQLAQVGPAKPLEPAGTVAIAGSFPRSFLIPGTDTSLLIGGQIFFDADHWFTGGNSNNTGAGSPIIGVPGLSNAPLSVPGSAKHRSNNITHFSVYASRLHFETRTPTAYGQAQTVVEFDFLGCSLGGIDCNNTVAGNDGLGARLRIAYATLGPFAVGQMYGPGTDLAASPEMLDLGCCAGLWAIGRLPQAVYTQEIWTPAGPASLGLALVDPEDSAVTPQGETLTNNTNLQNVSLTGVTFTTPQSATNAGLLATLNGGSNQLISINPLKTSWPDPVAGLNWVQPWGHLKLTAIVHQAALVDGLHLNKQYLGYGGGVSGDVKPGWLGWVKDDIGFTAFMGNGLGRYAGGGGGGNYFPYIATNYGAPTGGVLGAAIGTPGGYGHTGGLTTAAAAAGIRAQTIPEWGTAIWYQHWWTPTLRSTAEFGVVHQDVPTGLVGTLATGGNTNINKELVNVHLNLIWSPVPFIDTGIEYLWGHRLTLFKQKGDVNVLELATRVKF